ncbi:NUDIX domain-containing protein [Rhodoferax aquaticus]|uniref:NUDIX domain-containing protein n=1 Tax=Rhodoferax aquaticus TaxID=2527691 RepID=A0A515ESY7_9BURK|nr:NUDIX domain-containing protein [Rhodoferax aquaticus]QDL55784.1 NUDIX domain-containing protein [Rhodoferax aquaticus]
MTETKPTTSGTALIIGRWQIFHKGHETLLKAALATAPKVIVVIGSAFRSRNPQNPFTWQERQAMVESILSAEDKARVQYLPVRDYYDDTRWNAAVREGVQRITQCTQPITLVGFKKDSSSYYLDNFHGWAWKGVDREIEIDATALRNVYFEGADPDARLSVLQPYISPQVLAYLQAWARLPAFAERMSEHAAVAAYRKRWAAPFHLTADAVVQASGKVLLVRRGGDIGHGLWALPGGFVEPGERMYAAALRELQEETGFKTLAPTMQAAFQGSVVFDHPGRSPRGRIITHAHHFNLGNIALPEVKGADDAMEASWVPIANLPAMEDQLFDDHAAVLDRFLGVYR